jgi:hypothetical protein
VIGLVSGLALGLTEWVGIPTRTGWASRPQSTYKATRTLTALQLCLALLAIVLAFVLAGWLTVGLTVSLAAGLTVGLAVGLVGGLAAGLAARLAGGLIIRSGAWLSYVLATHWLTASGKLPLRLMDFLDDAYRLGLLRTVGPAYQFRHAEFQDHLVRTAGTLTTTDLAMSAPPASGAGLWDLRDELRHNHRVREGTLPDSQGYVSTADTRRGTGHNVGG